MPRSKRPPQILVELSDDDAAILSAWTESLRRRGNPKLSRQDVIRAVIAKALAAWLHGDAVQP